MLTHFPDGQVDSWDLQPCVPQECDWNATEKKEVKVLLSENVHM